MCEKGSVNKLRTNGLTIEIASDESVEGKFDVSLNVICNRFDLMYGEIHFLRIKEFPLLYIPFTIRRSVCYVGLYLLEIKQQHFYEILSFLKHRFFWVYKFSITNGLHNFKGGRIWNNFILELPNSYENYLATLSHRNRSHVRSEARAIDRDLCPTIEEIHTIDISLIHQYFALKDLRANRYKNAPEFLRTMHPTMAYVMYIDKKIAAMTMVSILEAKVAYAVGFAFHPQYSKYSIGKYLYLYTIRQLIERGVRKFILCGGSYAYKGIYKAISYPVYNGALRNINPLSLIVRAMDLPFLVARRIYRSIRL